MLLWRSIYLIARGLLTIERVVKMSRIDAQRSRWWRRRNHVTQLYSEIYRKIWTFWRCARRRLCAILRLGRALWSREHKCQMINALWWHSRGQSPIKRGILCIISGEWMMITKRNAHAHRFYWDLRNYIIAHLKYLWKSININQHINKDKLFVYENMATFNWILISAGKIKLDFFLNRFLFGFFVNMVTDGNIFLKNDWILIKCY